MSAQVITHAMRLQVYPCIKPYCEKLSHPERAVERVAVSTALRSTGHYRTYPPPLASSCWLFHYDHHATNAFPISNLDYSTLIRLSVG